MERHAIALIVLIGILLIASLFMQEGYVDASGADTSGNIISLSLSDLITILSGSAASAQAAPAPTTTIIQQPAPADAAKAPAGSEPSLDSQFYNSLRGDLLKDVRMTVRDQLKQQSAGSQTVLTDSCIDSVADQQGADWMRYIPGKNPADYIRKDSIPCYGCSIPT